MSSNHIDTTERTDESSVSKKRIRTSVVWDYFEEFIGDDGLPKARCSACQKTYTFEKGTTSMKNHLPKCFYIDGEGAESKRRRGPLDQSMFRRKMAIAIVKHNYSFSFVEHEGIRDLLSFLNPEVKHVSRNTIKGDILELYEEGKVIVKNMLESIPGKFCLTSDLWSSLTMDGYMTMTAHYVDEDWVLQKRILNFRHVPPPHNGPVLAEKVISYLMEWGIEKKVFTVTLDNAKYNDGLMEHLSKHLQLNGALVCGGEFLHVRCGAHILNLIVQAGLRIIKEAIHNIRESMKYIRGSSARKMKFAECIAKLSLKCGKLVREDIVTRWNSTYLMLDSALAYRAAFHQMQLIDSHFKTCPSSEEWKKVEKIAKFLKPFYEITTLFSGSSYPTANLYFQNVWKIQLLIQEELQSKDLDIRLMAKEMKEKFDKYWECYSMVLSFAIILDPRYKMKMVEYAFSKLNPATYNMRVQIVQDKLHMLFDEYVQASSKQNASTSEDNLTIGASSSLGDDMDEFDLFQSQYDVFQASKSQLDSYLEEPLLDRKQELDILQFWRMNQVRYPELSHMARDILSIPITTVASESSFSIGGRVISKYRSSILPSNPLRLNPNQSMD